jgi:parallel beta-helix repeat protein
MCSFILQVSAQPDIQSAWQEQWILAEDGASINLPEGTFHFTRTLSLEGKKRIHIKGAGMGKTVLSFAHQIEGGEGIRITNCESIKLEGFSVLDTKGDGVKAQNVHDIQFLFVEARWSGKPDEENGAYGLYPVQCQRVLLYECKAYGASDAGLYVGQCEQVVVRKCHAEGNVAGIEIENTMHADVVENTVTGNTGGILVFDLPDLEKKKGGDVEVYKNKVFENNHRNFAPEGNIVGQVPPGTGIMILATSDVHVFDNEIRNNRTVGTAIMSYYITEIPIKDASYDPYPSRIYIHNNTYERKKRWPILKNKFGKLFLLKFGRKVPHIIYDGIKDEIAVSPTTGRLLPEHEICIYDNTNESFANLDAGNKFKNLSHDLSLFRCK